VTSDSIVLTDGQQVELSRIAQSRSLPAGYVFRARMILMLAEGASFSTIKQRLGTTAPTIIRWKQRFLAAGLDGLDTSHPGQTASVLTPKLRARILAATRKQPKDGSTHWSCRKLAAALGVSKDAVHRVWREAGLKPHRLERYMASDDPDLETKAADIIGLYLNPPQHAAVFCVDEKTAIQALDRLDPVLPLSPGRAERHGFEYYRHGTLSLYAALDTATGRVHGKTAARHTSQDFVAFLKEVAALCPYKQQIHIILDNLSAHKRPRWYGSSWSRITASVSTSLPPTPPGSIRSNCGSPKSSAKSSPVASSPPSPIWPASSAATSTLTQPMLARSSGSTPTLLATSAVTKSLRQATSRWSVISRQLRQSSEELLVSAPPAASPVAMPGR
jgi:transposase